MVAICEIRQTQSEGRVYFEKKVAEGRTKKDAIRSFKRQISNTVYRHLVLDAQQSVTWSSTPSNRGPGRTIGNDS
jgi:transposase